MQGTLPLHLMRMIDDSDNVDVDDDDNEQLRNTGPRFYVGRIRVVVNIYRDSQRPYVHETIYNIHTIQYLHSNDVVEKDDCRDYRKNKRETAGFPDAYKTK